MDNSNYHGSDNYQGHCPDCGNQTFTCYDETCESCAKDKPVKCPKCFDMVHPDHMTEHGCCIVCLEYDADEFMTDTLKKLEVIEIVNNLNN